LRALLPRTLAQSVAVGAVAVAVLLGGLYAKTVRDAEDQARVATSMRMASAYDVLIDRLVAREPTLSKCIAKARPPAVPVRGPGTFRALLTVLSGHVIDVRVYQSPAWIDERTRACLVAVLGELKLPGVGNIQSTTLEAELELPRPSITATTAPPADPSPRD
jgi:hypothetical protein